MIELTIDEKEIIDIALTMRRNYIETGSISVSAKDLVSMGKHAEIHGAKLQLLHIDQMKLIIKIEELRTKIWH